MISELWVGFTKRGQKGSGEKRKTSSWKGMNLAVTGRKKDLQRFSKTPNHGAFAVHS